MNSKLLLVAVILVLAGGVYALVSATDKIDDTPPVPNDVKRDAGMFALLVGCTEYPYLKEEFKEDPAVYETRIRLQGSANDVDLLHTTFRDYLGVPDENITTLKGWPDEEAKRPTRENILANLDRFAGAAKKGDRFVFHFSGHGSQQRDTGDERDELDGLDEILLPADVRKYEFKKGNVPGSIADDELWVRLRAIRDAGATVWLSLDCCHSGGGTRGGDAQMRKLEPDLLGVTLEPEPAASTAPVPTDEDMSGVVTLTAAQAYQRAVEMVLPGDQRVRGRQRHGLYTFLLARTLQRYGGDLTFDELHAHLLAGYQAEPWDEASPTVEGSSELRVARHAAGGPRLRLRQVDGRLVLDAGAIRGLSQGSILEVFPPGQSNKPEASLGKIRIQTARLGESDCVPHEEDPFRANEAPPRPLPVVVRQVAVGEVTIPLAIVDGDGQPVAEAQVPEAVREAFSVETTSGRFPRVAPEKAQWLLRVGGARFTLERVEAGFESPRFVFEPIALTDTLYAVYRSLCLRRLGRGDVLQPLPERLKVEAFVAASQAAYKDGKREPIKPGMQLTPGAVFGLDVANFTRRFVDLTIVQLDGSYGVGVAFPNRSHPSCRLTKKETRTISLGPWLLTDETLGAESLLVLAVPCDGERDTISSFEFLAQPALEQTRSDESGNARFVRALLESNGRTRSAASPASESLTMKVIPWRTQWGSVHIPTEVRAKGTATSQPTALPKETPWYVGSHLAVLAGDADKADAIATWDEGVEQIYIDVEGDGGYEQANNLAGQIAAGTLQADLILRIEPGRRTAWYARPGYATKLPLRLVDEDGDSQADLRSLWTSDRWTDEPTRASWLGVANLTHLPKRDRRKAIKRLRTFVRKPSVKHP